MGDYPRDWETYRDTGCDWFASCFDCPLPKCRFDVDQRTATAMYRVYKRGLQEDEKVWVSAPKVYGIIEEVCQEHGVTYAQVASPDRHTAFARARMAAAKKLRTETDLTLKAIGLVLGHRDHSTIISAVQRAEELGL